MHGDRGNRRTEKATSQNIFEMTKIRDRSFVTSRGGRAVVLDGGYNFKTSPFLGVNFSLVRNMKGVKF